MSGNNYDEKTATASGISDHRNLRVVPEVFPARQNIDFFHTTSLTLCSLLAQPAFGVELIEQETCVKKFDIFAQRAANFSAF